jgi:hypothetical protein
MRPPMAKTPVLVSERLCFHPWEPEDFPLLAALHRDGRSALG